MTQKRIAKDLRISVSTLQRYETLRLRIPESMLLDYANLLTINQLSMERPVFQALHSKRTA
jgi:transcriptional regulator with XRE-family HTH domain